MSDRPDISYLVRLLDTDLDFTIFARDEKENEFTATVSGSYLDDEVAQLRIDNDICHFTVVVGVLESVQPEQRELLAINLLKANCNHIFGRVGLFKISGKIASRTEDTVLAIVCETMFYWSRHSADLDWLKTKFERRLLSLKTLADESRRHIRDAGCEPR